MAPPQVRKCYVPDCEYKTPENLNTLELQIRDLELHLKGAHHELGRANDSLLSQGGAGAAKPSSCPGQHLRKESLKLTGYGLKSDGPATKDPLDWTDKMLSIISGPAPPTAWPEDVMTPVIVTRLLKRTYSRE